MTEAYGSDMPPDTVDQEDQPSITAEPTVSDTQLESKRDTQTSQKQLIEIEDFETVAQQAAEEPSQEVATNSLITPEAGQQPGEGNPASDASEHPVTAEPENGSDLQDNKREDRPRRESEHDNKHKDRKKESKDRWGACCKASM